MGHRPMQTWRGNCHCGAVQFEIDTDFPELTTCDCSICRRKNALMVKVHAPCQRTNRARLRFDCFRLQRAMTFSAWQCSKMS